MATRMSESFQITEEIRNLFDEFKKINGNIKTEQNIIEQNNLLKTLVQKILIHGQKTKETDNFLIESYKMENEAYLKTIEELKIKLDCSEKNYQTVKSENEKLHNTLNSLTKDISIYREIEIINYGLKKTISRKDEKYRKQIDLLENYYKEKIIKLEDLLTKQEKLIQDPEKELITLSEKYITDGEYYWRSQCSYINEKYEELLKRINNEEIILPPKKRKLN